jgi:hypothetical protein
MFTVTKTIVFQPRRSVALALPTGNGQMQEPPPAPPILVFLELQCETEDEVSQYSVLGKEMVKSISRFFQGDVVFAHAAYKVFNECALNALPIQSVTINSEPGFQVKYQPQGVEAEKMQLVS